MKKTLEIFIASSSDYVVRSKKKIDIEATNKGRLEPVLEGIKEAKHTPIPWWDTYNVFPEGNTFLSNLIIASKKYDGGIFILGNNNKEEKIDDEEKDEKIVPNVNVLLEAGMFYASKGIKRTLIIIDGKYEKLDIGGYQIPKLSDADLKDRIRKFFNTPSSQNESKFDKCTYFISDQISTTVKSRFYNSWLTKGLYIGNQSVRIWENIEKSSSYKININQLHNIQKTIIDDKHIDFECIDNIVSLGCGSGYTDNSFLDKLKRINDNICYIPVDINPLMAFTASQNISKTVRVPFAIIDDFEDNVDHIKNIIERRVRDIGQVNFFMMIGVTFSNLEKNEMNFFNKVSDWMDSDDYFLIDVSLNSSYDLDSMINATKDVNYKKLFYNSLLKKMVITDEKIDEVDIITEKIECESILSSYTEIKNTQVYCYRYKDHILLVSKRYNYDDIKNEIEDTFNLKYSREVESQSGRKKAFFLFKKK